MRKKTYILILSCLLCFFATTSNAQNISCKGQSSSNFEAVNQQEASISNITPENVTVFSISNEVPDNTNPAPEEDLDIIIADNPLIIIRGKDIDPKIFANRPIIDDRIILDKQNNALPEKDNALPAELPQGKDAK